MPVPTTPMPSASTPSAVGRRFASERGRAEGSGIGDPLEEPINRGSFAEQPDEDETGDSAGPLSQSLDSQLAADDGELADAEISGDFKDPAQPLDDDGVTDDMSSLALNPIRLNAGELERLAEQDVAGGLNQGVLHLNGDFAGLDDAAVMLELKAGNMTAFDHLLQKYRRPIIHFMMRMTRNQAVAEELAQEVFLRVYRSRETYRAEARFSTWLYRIATNLGVNHARDTRHERMASTVYLDETDPETGSSPDVADSTPLAEAVLLRDERMAAIREFVMALPERQRMAVLMHKYEGMDYKQIGEVLKLSESATKSLLFRAYQTLRGTLKDFV